MNNIEIIIILIMNNEENDKWMKYEMKIIIIMNNEKWK